jgi:hypothetical protein
MGESDRTPQLGETWAAVLNGFQGVVTGLCVYLTGCDTACLSPSTLKSDGEPHEGRWFDVPFLRFVSEADPDIMAVYEKAHAIGETGGASFTTPAPAAR